MLDRFFSICDVAWATESFYLWDDWFVVKFSLSDFVTTFVSIHNVNNFSFVIISVQNSESVCKDKTHDSCVTMMNHSSVDQKVLAVYDKNVNKSLIKH